MVRRCVIVESGVDKKEKKIQTNTKTGWMQLSTGRYMMRWPCFESVVFAVVGRALEAPAHAVRVQCRCRNDSSLAMAKTHNALLSLSSTDVGELSRFNGASSGLLEESRLGEE